MTLLATNVLGSAKGGKMDTGIDLEGIISNKVSKFFKGEIPSSLDIEDDKISEGNAPPNSDPGMGLPGGVNLSVKRGNEGFIDKNMAVTAVIIERVTSIRKLRTLVITSLEFESDDDEAEVDASNSAHTVPEVELEYSVTM